MTSTQTSAVGDEYLPDSLLGVLFLLIRKCGSQQSHIQTDQYPKTLQQTVQISHVDIHTYSMNRVDLLSGSGVARLDHTLPTEIWAWKYGTYCAVYGYKKVTHVAKAKDGGFPPWGNTVCVAMF